MEFADFAARAAEIEAEPADLEITALVRELLGAAGVDLPIVARFVQGRVFPAWDSTTLDIGPRLCYEAVARAAGPNVTAGDVESRLAEVGDIGEVAADYEFGGQRGLGSFAGGDDDGLTVAEVFEELSGIAAAEGAGSQDRKLDVLFGLLNRTDPREARYLVRLVLSEMRIGVGEGTVRDAVADAFDVPVEDVEYALQVTNDHGRVAEIARERGAEGLADVGLEVGRPVQAMLAQAGTIDDALESWETAAVETKYDGARVQLHYGEEVSVFSRNMEDVTGALPEVVEFAEEHAEPPVILDGEVVAVDDAGDPLPFQEILRRFRRKHDVDRMREEVAVEFHAFDCLHAPADADVGGGGDPAGDDDRSSDGTPAGEDLLDAPLTERRDRLSAALDAGVSEVRLSGDPEEVAAIEADALEAGHEGIMLKNPESTYSPGKRGQNWLKRKPDVETLDLVVTGAEWGEGRRAKFLGTFLLSARVDDGAVESDADDEEADRDASAPDAEYVTIGKVATGITDEKLAELTELLEPEIRSQDGTEVDLRPAVVFEVGYEEIQTSPTYSSGYALRFPRFVAVREDKNPEDADSLARVERLAESQ